jgi:hypothetical protein
MYSAALTDAQVMVDYDHSASANFGTGAAKESSLMTDGTGNPPLVYYNFDENTGATLNDTSTLTLALNATLRQTYSWSTGKEGQSIYFDGSSSGSGTSAYLGSEVLNGYTTGTISFWFKPNDTGDDWQDMFAFGDSSTFSNGLELAYERSTDRVNVWSTGCDGGTNIVAYASLPGTQTAWHFLSYVDTGSGNAMYIDGMPVTLTYTTGNASTTCFTSSVDENTDYTFLGCASGTTSTCYANEMYEGRLDEFKFYNYARTSAQIWYDYNRGKPLAWWALDDCQATTANDSSGNGYTGTLNIGATGTYTSAGSCGSGTSTEAWNAGTSGKRNSALGFDGTNDYVQVSDTANLRFDSSAQDFSLFAWVKRTTTGTEYIISKEDADNDGWRMLFNSSNQVVCSEDATDVTSSSAITDTNWHHIGCTIDRNGNGHSLFLLG